MPAPRGTLKKLVNENVQHRWEKPVYYGVRVFVAGNAVAEDIATLKIKEAAIEEHDDIFLLFTLPELKSAIRRGLLACNRKENEELKGGMWGWLEF
tara:strand:+ start:253 stop:540 length:288 start_codon:yes stop_codon:yes gene_type:complete